MAAGRETKQRCGGDGGRTGGGADTITFAGELTASTVKGKGGADLITVSGLVGTGSEILGNAGGDTITLAAEFAAGSANMIGAGSGNDSIVLTGTNFGYLYFGLSIK